MFLGETGKKEQNNSFGWQLTQLRSEGSYYSAALLLAMSLCFQNLIGEVFTSEERTKKV